ncbi:hypothetical protein, partial [Enterococcus faecium]|uniref:hypothetical protein n=1 Tax=Enterococcus faecium TaxID=1352 RepID=UPI001C613F38
KELFLFDHSYYLLQGSFFTTFCDTSVGIFFPSFGRGHYQDKIILQRRNRTWKKIIPVQPNAGQRQM